MCPVLTAFDEMDKTPNCIPQKALRTVDISHVYGFFGKNYNSVFFVWSRPGLNKCFFGGMITAGSCHVQKD